MERLEQHRLYPPFEAMGVMADAISTLLHADPQTSGRTALGESGSAPHDGMEKRRHEGQSAGGDDYG